MARRLRQTTVIKNLVLGSKFLITIKIENEELGLAEDAHQIFPKFN